MSRAQGSPQTVNFDDAAFIWVIGRTLLVLLNVFVKIFSALFQDDRTDTSDSTFLLTYYFICIIVPTIDGKLRWKTPMATPLEKARKDPDSMKARILHKARLIFGQYGFHGATTRMIAEEVGIDISTLYYHWGEKSDLYEAVILDINEDLKIKLLEVENVIHKLPIEKKVSLSLDLMTDYLFEHAEVSNLILFRYFAKTRDESVLDFHVPEVVTDIARSLGLAKDRRNISNEVRMQVYALMNAIHNFVSGENFFRSMLKMPREEYMALAKETIKFVLLPAFAGPRPANERTDEQNSSKKIQKNSKS